MPFLGNRPPGFREQPRLDAREFDDELVHRCMRRRVVALRFPTLHIHTTRRRPEPLAVSATVSKGPRYTNCTDSIEFICVEEHLRLQRLRHRRRAKAMCGYSVDHGLRPRDETAELDILGHTRTALRGLYDAQIDLAYLAAGMFSGDGYPRMGLVQSYGVVAWASDRATSIHRAQQADAALVGTLANFIGINTQPLSKARTQFITAAITRWPYIVALLGQPDPRESPLATARATDTVETEKPAEQNELLFRGLARLQEDFVFFVLGRRIKRRDAARFLDAALQEASIQASQMQGTRNISFNFSIPYILNRASTLTDSRSHADGETRGRSAGVSEERGYARTAGESHTESHSRTEGQSETWGESHTQGVAHSALRSVSEGVIDTESQATGTGTAHTDSHAVGEGSAHTEGHAVSEGTAHTEGQAHTHGSSSFSSSSQASGGGSSWGSARTVGVSVGQANTQGEAQTDSVTNTDTNATTRTNSESHGTSFGAHNSVADTISSGNAQSHSAMASEGATGGIGGSLPIMANYSAGTSEGHTDSVSSGTSHANTQGTSAGTSRSTGTSVGTTSGHATAHGAANTQSQAQTDSVSVQTATVHSQGGSSFSSSSHSSGSGTSQSHTTSVADTTSRAETDSVADSVSRSESWGTADSVAASQSQGTARSHSRVETHSSGTTVSNAHTQSHAVTRSSAETWGTAAQSDTYSQSQGRSHTESFGQSATDARLLARGLATGVSTGVTGGVSIGKATQWRDEAAAYLAELWQRIARLADTMSQEGAYEVESFVVTRTERGAKAAEALAIQAFHGLEDVVLPVTTARLSAEEREHIAGHLATFSPCLLDPPEGIAAVLAGGRYATANTLHQLAALVAPATFEDGLASTNISRPPDFAFYTDMPGDVQLGYQYSAENYTGAAPTEVPLRLSEDAFYSFAVVGDSGTGKTTFGERLVLETTTKWQLRSVVLDFGAGWTRMLNAPGLQGHTEAFSISPYGPNPLRYNPLQVPHRIHPGEYYMALADLAGGTTGMGVVQMGELQETLQALYTGLGVLVNEPQVLRNPDLNKVTAEETAVINQAREDAGHEPRSLKGTHLSRLRPGEKQALAVHRSRKADIAELVGRIRYKVEKANGHKEETLRNIELRLQPFVQADIYQSFKPLDEGELGTEIDVLSQPWGLTVISGGQGIPETAKAFLIAQIAWVIYHDAAAYLDEVGVLPHRGLHIFIDEMQKLFGGAQGARRNNEEPTTSAQLKQMWPDSRKYGIAMSLGTQNPSLVGVEIISNCNNVATFRLKHPEDRDLMAEIMGWSSKGYHDINSVTYLGTMPQHRCLVYYANSPLGERSRKPALIKPLRVPGHTHPEAEAAERYGVPIW